MNLYGETFYSSCILLNGNLVWLVIISEYSFEISEPETTNCLSKNVSYPIGRNLMDKFRILVRLHGE